MKFSKLTKPEIMGILTNDNFTDEEKHVFEMLVKNKSLDQISQALMISKPTVSRRVKDIKIKMERNENNMVKTIPIWEKLTLTVEEAAEYSNIGINKINNMLNEPSCSFVLFVGRKKLVKRKEFEKFIEKSSGI